MSKGFYGFKSSLRQGQIGEIIFFEAHCKDMLKLDGFKADFQYIDGGDTLELKTDFWNMNDTPNMFFERFSNEEKQTPGGPWQAQANGCKYFTYLYVANLTYFRFETDKLVAKLEEILPSLKATEVANKNYKTIGYRVPREAVEFLAQKTTMRVSV